LQDFFGGGMSFSSFSDYFYFSILLSLPIVKTIKFIYQTKSKYKTSSGREIDPSLEKESELDLELKDDLSFIDPSKILVKPKIYEIFSPHLISLIGFHKYFKPAIVTISPGLEKISKPLIHWLYKRVGFFLAKGAHLKLEVIKIFGSFCLSIYFAPLCTSSLWLPLTLVILCSKALEIFTFYIFEIRADDYVTQASTIEEINAAISLLKAEVAFIEKQQTPFNIQELIHKKTLEKRIKTLLVALGKENILENESLTHQLEEFLFKNHLEEQKFIEAKKMKVLRWIDADED
jgi:hypothetical protein